MEFILSRFRNLTVLLIAILAQLVLLAYQVKSNQDVRLIRVWSVTAVTPIAKVLEVVRQYTIGFVESYFLLVNVRDQNRRLQEEVGRLKLDNQFLRTELQTADRAQALAAFQARTPSRTIPSRIIGTGTGANSKVVFVDRGSTSGVMRGMAVITPDGIVGRVLASFPTAAQVLLITDPSFAAGVISEKNRVHGTLKGLGQSKCMVDYVQNEEKVDVGEMFYTSGDDRVFPKGMPVGKVSGIREGDGVKQIFVVPSGFQNGVEEVLIVLESVHQAIPEAQVPVAQDVYLAPPPPEPGKTGAAPNNAAETPGSISTAADKIHDRYKRIGDAQHHVFGQGAYKAPDFNIDPDKAVAPKPPSPAPNAGATPRETPANETPNANTRPRASRPPTAANPVPTTPVP